MMNWGKSWEKRMVWDGAASARRAWFVPISLFAVTLMAAAGLYGKPQASRRPQTHRYVISPGVSIDLTSDWAISASVPASPPAALAPYAPAFHFSGITMLLDAAQSEVLQFAPSDNPLVGHDSNWLDGQMHASNATGANLLNYLYYYFFPSPAACLENLLNHPADATRVPEADEHAPGIQVSHACHFAATLSDFFASQVSSGIAFRQTTEGSIAFAAFQDFYVAPMQEVDASGMTFYVFEAQRTAAAGSDAASGFHLPESFQGGHADYFAAVGAPSPFPFVDDGRASTVPIIHIVFAAVNTGGSRAADFTRLLQQVRYSSSSR